MKESLRPEVNENKKITGKLKRLKLMRNFCVCREEKDEVRQEKRSSLQIPLWGCLTVGDNVKVTKEFRVE